MTNEELLKEAVRYRDSAKELEQLRATVKRALEDGGSDVNLQAVVLQHRLIADAFEELVRLRTQAEPPSSPVSGEGVDSRVNGG